MRKVVRLSLVLFGLSLATSLLADPGPMAIWFTTPATPGDDTSWQRLALPVGNGKLGAMIYGGVGSEQIQFNEDTIWGGQPHDYSNPSASAVHLAALQTECFNFTANATMSADEKSYLIGSPIQQAAYQNPGALVFAFPHNSPTGYQRTLNLNTATVNVQYTNNGVGYNRDVFASAPSNKVIAIHFTASQSGNITFSCSFATAQTATYSTSGNDLVMHASVTAFSKTTYGLANLVKYDARVRLIATGGTVSKTSSSISVTNADDVVLLLGVASNATNYNALDQNTNYVTICSNNVAAAATLGYTALRQAQQNDYTNLFNRVVLDLGGNSRTNQDIGYRKNQIALDGNDPQLVALDFQLGRYLMISGSRPGSQALNLQGKWNDSNAPSWDCKMTLNINEEMNYWGAEVCNLSECTLPLFDMMQDLAVTGHTIATNTYFVSATYSNAWVVHHNTDFWRAAAPCNGSDGVWPTGGAWLCQHVWWHFLYTGDTNWLATNGYPLMKGAAQFFQGFLVKCKYPNNTNWPATYTNWLVTCPSFSPEHDLSNTTTTVAGPTMDNELLRDLFSHVIAASQILNTDATFSVSISNLMAQLPPDQVGHLGQLQEWLQDYDDSGHRHCSQLVGFFPGDEISTYYTPVTAAAAKRSVDLRGYANSALTPWSCAWRLNLRTRLLDGNGAWTNLLFLYGYNKVATNLVFADVPNRQLDCVFGRLSGIAEMFLQSQCGDVILLPALPTQLTNGAVSGLCARGGFEVDNMSWTNGRLTGATILSKLGNTCRLRPRIPVNVMLGTNYVDAPMVLPGLYQFSTIAGSNYTIVPAYEFETESLSASISAGDTHQIVTNAAFSNLRGTLLTANAASDYVTYTLSNVNAGTYHVYIGSDAGTNRGKFQLACGPSGGALTNVGTVQDTYSATNMAYLLPINLYTPTNLIVLWTNMLRELDCGTWPAPSNGNYQFKFTVDSKNTGSSGYNLAFDYIKLTPATAQQSSDSAPTDISLSNASVPENQPVGTTVGTFSTTDPDTGDTFTYTLVSGTGSTDNASFTISSNTLQTAAVFDFETKSSYSIRVRSTDQGGLYFEKAFTITVANVNEAPATPTNLLPANGAVNQSPTPALQTSVFSDPDAGDTHAASEWLVWLGSTNVFDSGTDPINKTNLTVPSDKLEFAATYNWQVRFQDNHGLWSGYSTPTTFSTTTPTLNAAGPGVSLVLSWPTNTTGFSLESTTNLVSANWTPVSPPPVIVDGNNVVTNTAGGEQMFYRLHQP
jgi:alpha-L-fucosidase 2